MERVLSGHWRERVADPDWLVQCVCRHYEQMHNIHGCTAGPYNHPCQCGTFIEARREWVGQGPRP